MSLARTQFLSLGTKAMTTALGIIQSLIIVKVLSPEEYGLIGLVMSIGGVIGVTQHLGIVDGAIREIAVLTNKRDIGKVFWVSHIIRQAVTLPLSLGLVLVAYVLATYVYGRPEITPFIQLFAAALVLQALQDVLGATLTGMKQFKTLYGVQIITAALNIAAFGYLTWQFKIAGFFWAIILTTTVMVVLFSLSIARNLRGHLAIPRWREISQYGRRVLRISAYMYLARIFFMVWQRLPLLVLGSVLANEQLGFINISFTFGSKLTILAMALSEVNLSWMSSLFVTEKETFRQVAARNMQRVLIVMTSLTLVLLFFTHEILRFIIPEYLPAQDIIIVTTAAFFLYALTDIGTSSVFVPADKPRSRALVYGIMMSVTAVITAALLILRPDPFLASLGVMAGAIAAYGATVYIARRQFGVPLVTSQLALFLVALAAGTIWLVQEPPFIWRLLVFLVLGGYTAWETHRGKLLPASWYSRLHGFWQPAPEQGTATVPLRIICFAGAAYHSPTWTNRQHIMSRVSRVHPVLYVEPRIWLLRFLVQHWSHPRELKRFFRRLWWSERVHDGLILKAQANLLPGSREFAGISRFNYLLNRWNVLVTARLLGFTGPQVNHQRSRIVVWLYDTEAAEYLPAFPGSTVIYDCVDDHASQVGPNRNADRVRREEEQILTRADIVTVTSRQLVEQKKVKRPDVKLVLNAGDVTRFVPDAPHLIPATTPALRTLTQLAAGGHPIIGTVGSLDTYKINSELIKYVAATEPTWHFVFIGQPAVDPGSTDLELLAHAPNIHLIGLVPHADVPHYVRYFNVCLIPYRTSQYNAASFPLKFWEFMATGKPIVVTGVPELKYYDSHIGYATTPTAFHEEIKKALASGEFGRDARIVEARHHSWEERTATLLELVHATVKHKAEHL